MNNTSAGSLNVGHPLSVSGSKNGLSENSKHYITLLGAAFVGGTASFLSAAPAFSEVRLQQ